MWKSLLVLVLCSTLSCQILIESASVATGAVLGLAISGGSPMGVAAGSLIGLLGSRYVVVTYISPPLGDIPPDNFLANIFFQIRRLLTDTMNGLVIIILALFVLPLITKKGRTVAGHITRKIAGNSASKKELDTNASALNNIETRICHLEETGSQE